MILVRDRLQMTFFLLTSVKGEFEAILIKLVKVGGTKSLGCLLYATMSLGGGISMASYTTCYYGFGCKLYMFI